MTQSEAYRIILEYAQGNILKYSWYWTEHKRADFCHDFSVDLSFKIHKWNPARGAFLAWVNTCMRYELINRSRKRKLDTRSIESIFEDSYSLLEVVGYSTREVREDDFFEKVLSRMELAEWFTTYFLRSKKIRELSVDLDIPVGTIKNRIWHAKQEFKEVGRQVAKEDGFTYGDVLKQLGVYED